LDAVENGYALFREAADSPRPLVHLIRLKDGRQTTIDPLPQITEADQVIINDVSVGKSGIVAIAANAIKNPQAAFTTVGLLLTYNTDGKLLAAHRMHEAGQASDYIVALKVDDDDGIWALHRGEKSLDSTTAPFLYKYTDFGARSDVIYTRNGLPHLYLLRPYLPAVGRLSFGVTSTSVYCWIPSMQTLVIMLKDGSGMRQVSMVAPRPSNVDSQCRTKVIRVLMTESGAILADVFFERPCAQPNVQSYRAIFAFDAERTNWRELRFDLPPVVLVGIDGERPILMSKWVTPTVLDSTHWLFKREI
jgi:hypothetical protein